MTWPDTQVDYKRHVQRSAVVQTVEEAFAFCLTGIEEEAIEMPVVSVEPMMIYDDTAPEGRIVFEVVMSGQSQPAA